MNITLQIFERDQEILSKSLDEGVYRVGRSEFCDIVLANDSVSRTHLELRVTAGNIYMTNVSASGKVRVNNQPFETAELMNGDAVEIGNFRILVYIGEDDQNAAGEFNQLENGAPSADPIADENASESPYGENPDGSLEASPEADDLGQDNLAQLSDFRPEPQENNGFAPQMEGTAALARAETVVEMHPVVAKLLFTDGPRKGEELFLETYEVNFGRSKRADIFLDDEKLSRKHAKIARIGMGYRLIDLNSRNGTFVNGMRVLEHPLNSFDVIEMGSTKIKFLIHDIIASEVAKGALVAGSRSGMPALEQTRSLKIATEDEPLAELPATAPVAEALNQPYFQPQSKVQELLQKRKLSPKATRITFIVVVLLLGIYFLLPSGKPNSKTVSTDGKPQPPPVAQSLTTKEYLELTPEMQRSIEGHYTSAMRAADQDNYEEAIANLKKIHEILPYYKQSKELLEQYGKRLKEKQIQEAADKAKKDEKQELALYLDDGTEYLKNGDFERAAEAFNSAITLDPNNPIAIKGLKAAEYKIRRLEDVPPDRDPEKEKQEAVQKLFEKAVDAFSRKSYQEAIDNAEEIRKIEIRGETQYLNEAKQIIDKSRQNQKEEFEPFLTEAKEKYAEGDYNATRDLTEEMLKRNPAYDEAKDLLAKTKKQLNRLAKEAYVRGYILESMSRLDEAKQYWNRAKNYTRPGDDYFDKVNKKLEQYQ